MIAGCHDMINRFPQGYAVERVKLEACKKVYSATGQALVDGSVTAVVRVEGVA